MVLQLLRWRSPGPVSLQLWEEEVHEKKLAAHPDAPQSPYLMRLEHLLLDPADRRRRDVPALSLACRPCLVWVVRVSLTEATDTQQWVDTEAMDKQQWADTEVESVL